MGVRRNLLMQNFAKPEGYFGNLLGQYMADENQGLNEWAVDTLKIEPTDRLLEVGYGPGLAVLDMTNRATEGYVAGIDYSVEMLVQALKANSQGIAEGRVDLRLADVAELPTFKTPFDKILAVNNAMYWPQPVETLAKLRGMLRHNGHIAIVIQRTPEAVENNQCDAEIQWYVQRLYQAGFPEVKISFQPIQKDLRQMRRNPLIRMLGKELLQIYATPSIMGICIQGINSTPYAAMLAQWGRRQPYSKSKTLFLK